MKLPSIALALALSLAAGVATVRFAMAPMDDAAAARLRDTAAACEGYDMLHVLLSSAHSAEEFRRDGHCMEKLSGGRFGRQR